MQHRRRLDPPGLVGDGAASGGGRPDHLPTAIAVRTVINVVALVTSWDQSDHDRTALSMRSNWSMLSVIRVVKDTQSR